MVMSMNESMLLRRVSILSVLVAGCPDDTTSLGDESSSTGDPMPPTSSSTAPTTSATSTEPPTGSEDSGSSSSAADTSSSSETTEGPMMPTGHARFFVREDTSEDREHPMYREYSEGVLSDPVPLVADLASDVGVSIGGIEPGGAHFAYCVNGAKQADEECFVRELASFPDGTPQPLGTRPVPVVGEFSLPEWIDAWGAYYFSADAPNPSPEGGEYRVGVADGVLATPELLVASVGDVSPSGEGLSPDLAWISFTATLEVDGPTEVFVIPTDGGDPTAWIQVSDVADPEVDPDVAAYLHGSQALVYGVDDTDGPPDGNAAYYLADLTALPMVGTPVRVDAPHDELLRVRGFQIAPDDHALVYWIGGGGSVLGELMLVELDGLAPGLATRISTTTEAEVFRTDYSWSPDSRWLVYTGTPDVDEAAWSVYFVDLSGATPAEPVVAADALLGGVEVVGFDAESRWFYYLADVGDGFSLFRIDVSGAEPSAPQLLAAPPSPVDWLTGEAIWSNDRNELLYTMYIDALEVRQLWIVDVSGDEPGTPTRVDTLRRGPGVQFGARFSPDDGLIVYSEDAVESDGPTPLWLIDRSAPDEPLRLSDDAYTAVFLPE